ncbi:MAG: Zn-ribbon domain-containing OB-fold protein [Alphaproteobacteria bacterium]
MSENYTKPIPEPSIDSQPFWDALNEGRLVFQACVDCGKLRHYPRPICDECYSDHVEWKTSNGKGVIYSWTETHHPFHIGFRGETPYILVTAEFDGGVRIQTQLLDAKVEDLKIGMHVEVVLTKATEDLTLPLLRLA